MGTTRSRKKAEIIVDIEIFHIVMIISRDYRIQTDKPKILQRFLQRNINHARAHSLKRKM